MKLGVITGLRAEARLFGPSARPGGGTPEGAARAAEELVAAGATALLSFGLAGGLDPTLKPGALLVPRRVVGRAGPQDADAWDADPALLAWLGGATVESLLGGETVAATHAAKATLFRRSGAAGIDLESGAVAATAARHGIGFAVLRAVCDPAMRDLPPAALLALDTVGAIGFGRVGACILRDPRQLPALMRLAADAALARRALGRAVASLHLAASVLA